MHAWKSAVTAMIWSPVVACIFNGSPSVCQLYMCIVSNQLNKVSQPVICILSYNVAMPAKCVSSQHSNYDCNFIQFATADDTNWNETIWILNHPIKIFQYGWCYYRSQTQRPACIFMDGHVKISQRWHSTGKLLYNGTIHQCQKSSLLKLFAIFSLISIFQWNFATVCCQFISTHIYQFWSIYLNIQQNGINFSRSTYCLISVSNFTKSNCGDFYASDEWPVIFTVYNVYALMRSWQITQKLLPIFWHWWIVTLWQNFTEIYLAGVKIWQTVSKGYFFGSHCRCTSNMVTCVNTEHTPLLNVACFHSHHLSDSSDSAIYYTAYMHKKSTV